MLPFECTRFAHVLETQVVLIKYNRFMINLFYVILTLILGQICTQVAADDTEEIFAVRVASEIFKTPNTLEQAFFRQAETTYKSHGYEDYVAVDFRYKFTYSLGPGNVPVRRGFAHGWVSCYD